MKTEEHNISILLYLIACSLHNEKPDESKLTGIDIEELFHMAMNHSLSAIVYIALQKTEVFQHTDPVIAKQWKELKEKTICKNIMLDAERKQILAELENRNIWYMPLKGCILKNLYPSEYMREMADNDILYDEKYQEEVRDIFLERGYTAISYGNSNHDVYEKKPIYNFEMHSSLFSSEKYPELHAAFKNIHEKFIADTDNICGRHLSNDDYYIYMTVHSYKHHTNAGTGLRTLVDFYVMYKKFRGTSDRKYVSEQLRRMKIDNYEKSCQNLAFHLFEKTELVDLSVLPPEEYEILMRCFSSGTYGTFENGIINKLKKCSDDGKRISRKTKIKYCLQRLFPCREWYKVPYPLFYKFPVLIPFFRIYRIFRAFLFNRKKICSEIRTTICYNGKKQK